MATYILLMHLDREGRERMLEDPESLQRAEAETHVEGVQCLGLYGVLGRFDFITILEADDNDAAAQFSLELGVRAGAQIETLPAVPYNLFGKPGRRRGSPAFEGVQPEQV